MKLEGAFSMEKNNMRRKGYEAHLLLLSSASIAAAVASLPF